MIIQWNCNFVQSDFQVIHSEVVSILVYTLFIGSIAGVLLWSSSCIEKVWISGIDEYIIFVVYCSDYYDIMVFSMSQYSEMGGRGKGIWKSFFLCF